MIPLALSSYKATIVSSNETQPNKEFLDKIRSYNHRMIDTIHSIRPLQGCTLLDLGASPHGYALERALEHQTAFYMGIGLDVASPQLVVGPTSNVGMLLRMNAECMSFSSDIFDAIVSFSTFEHVQHMPTVLAEMARVLKPDGLALIEFEPIWSCSYGHHLHHFGAWTRVVPPWAHLLWTSQQMRAALAPIYPADASLSLDDMIAWIYEGEAINRCTIRRFHAFLQECPLKAEWLVELKEEHIDSESVQRAAAATGFSPEELTTRGISVLLRKS